MAEQMGNPVGYKGLLDSSASLDNIVNTGSYRVTTASGVPIEGAYGILVVIRTDNYVCQTFYANVAVSSYAVRTGLIRSGDTVTWRTWSITSGS